MLLRLILQLGCQRLEQSTNLSEDLFESNIQLASCKIWYYFYIKAIRFVVAANVKSKGLLRLCQ